MRLCRYAHQGQAEIGFVLEDESILPLKEAAEQFACPLPPSTNLLDFLPGGGLYGAVQPLKEFLDPSAVPGLTFPATDVQLLVPVPDPGKLLLLAGNYAKHVEESGGRAEERERTFPYVFMKPPATTLTHPGDPVRIPEVSPNQIDWEIELAVIIGQRCSRVSEADALNYVAGYTVINDITDRGFTKQPGRVERPRDGFFDWLHGKWHDTFCPMGPCVLSADDCPDPQNLRMVLAVNGHVEQDGNTADMVFPVAALIEFISSFVTLLPGDIISTGTPHGIGKAKGKFLKSGDLLEAYVERIGTLRNPVV
ncbi:fumarylacetoacetate hydrolase family protein [Planctomicrobium sp. SH664]|uniref:fumarylacetoacetate hydrolase family protein n=1 Tax=Planctomicrobium sp. SH664 TaxID=3448125 RepID=UPI003F5B45A7